MHQPVQPCAKSPGCPESCISKGCARDGVSSCLDSRILRHVWRSSLAASLFQSRLPMRLRVAPHPASSGSAGDGLRVASRLASFSASRVKLQVAPLLRSSVCASRCVPGLPRLLHLPALPAMDLRVAPNLASFSASGASTLGFPAVFASPVAPADAFPGLPRFLHLPALPATDLSSCPASRVLRRIWRWCFGLPLGFALPVAPPGMVAGCPALLHLPALPWVRVSGLPRILSPSAPADGSPSCLGSRTLRLCRPCVFRLP